MEREEHRLHLSDANYRVCSLPVWLLQPLRPELSPPPPSPNSTRLERLYFDTSQPNRLDLNHMPSHYVVARSHARTARALFTFRRRLASNRMAACEYKSSSTRARPGRAAACERGGWFHYNLLSQRRYCEFVLNYNCGTGARASATTTRS